MKWVFVALLIVGLAGCATYSELQQRAPLYAGSSAKNPQSYISCAMPRWMDTNAATHVIADGDSQVVVIPSDGQFADKTIATLTVRPKGDGSTVEWRDMASRGRVFEARKAAVTDCL